MDGLDERQERDEIYVTSTCIGTVYLTLRCWSEENSSVGFQAFAWPGTPTLGLSNSLITVHWLSIFSMFCPSILRLLCATLRLF